MLYCEDCASLCVPPYTFCREHARQNEIPDFHIPEHQNGWKNIVQEAPKREADLFEDLVSWFYSDLISQYLEYCMDGNDLKLIIPVRPVKTDNNYSKGIGWEFFIPLRDFSQTQINELMDSKRRGLDNMYERYTDDYFYTATFFGMTRRKN